MKFLPFFILIHFFAAAQAVHPNAGSSLPAREKEIDALLEIGTTTKLPVQRLLL
ncbi:hypothetical protein [Flavitalea sp.]|nr:hypothetical protein [Flavitalea sp.]